MATWFYKDGKGEIFENNVCPTGYSDSPKGDAKKEVKSVVKKKAKKEIPLETD